MGHFVVEGLNFIFNRLFDTVDCIFLSFKYTPLGRLIVILSFISVTFLLASTTITSNVTNIVRINPFVRDSPMRTLRTEGCRTSNLSRASQRQQRYTSQPRKRQQPLIAISTRFSSQDECWIGIISNPGQGVLLARSKDSRFDADTETSF